MTFSPDIYEKLGAFYLGHHRDSKAPVLYDSRDLVTHAVCVGMTGSGKTGLCIGLLEEAVMDGVPAIIIDPKGDMGNLLLAFPELAPDDFEPWVDPDEARRKNLTVEALAAQKATLWKNGLEASGQSGERIRRFKEKAEFTIYTPGSSSGRSVSMLSSLEAPDPSLIDDYEMFSERVNGTVTSLLGLLGIDGDPIQNPDHIFVANLLQHYWKAQKSLDLAGLIGAIQHPPISKIGVMDLDSIYDAKKRAALAMKLNNLLASPSFAAWLNGDPMDVSRFLHADDGRPKISIFSIAHLQDKERMFFVSLLLNQVVGWMRGQSGTTSLRALLYMDEIFGYLPPVAEPPSKKPLMTMLKQARAYGLGVVLATQNPADIDYKALSNTGTWFIGRLQTERDRNKVLDGLSSSSAEGFQGKKEISDTLTGLESRQFLLHNVHEPTPTVFETRWVMSYLKGPLTREDIKTLSPKPEPTRATIPPGDQAAIATGPVVGTSVVSPTSELPPVATAETRAGLRPVIPDGVEEWFMPINESAPEETAQLVLRPMVYGFGTALFEVAAQNIRKEIPFGLVHGLSDDAILDWSNAFRVDLEPNRFSKSPVEGAEFLPLPSVDKKALAKWQKGLVDFIYRNESIDTYQCKKLKLKSEKQETESDFIFRVRDALKEKRDGEMDKLQERYDKKLETAENRVRKAEEKLEVQEDQARSAKMDSVLSVGTSIFSALTGGRSRSARTSVRSVSRASKESNDVERAEEGVDTANEKFVAVQLEFDEKLTELVEKFDEANYPVDSKLVSPKKSNIAVSLFALAWVPYWVTLDGKKHLATI